VLRIVTCHEITVIQMNAPYLNPSQVGWYVIYLPHCDGRLSWPGWLVIYRDGLAIHKVSCRGTLLIETDELTTTSKYNESYCTKLLVGPSLANQGILGASRASHWAVGCVNFLGNDISMYRSFIFFVVCSVILNPICSLLSLVFLRVIIILQ